MSKKSVQERYQIKYFYGSSHWWVKNVINEFEKGKKILDIGPGSGFISDLYPSTDYNLVAVEVDKNTREILRSKYQSVVSSVSELEENVKFDYILLLDVLEHMEDPFAFLLNLQKYAHKETQFLISLPNVAHWSVRLPLLFGIFDYYDRGIMDKTHLQFFTRKRSRELINYGQLEILSENSTIEPIEFVLPKSFSQNPIFNLVSKIRHNLAKILPGFFAYQHLIHAKSK